MLQMLKFFLLSGSPKTWVPRDRLQACSLRTALTYILDITTPPSQALLQLLATVATSETDTARLELLAKVAILFVI